MHGRIRRPRTSLAIAGLLFAVVTVVRFQAGSVADAYSLLYALPITLVALEAGAAAGLAAAAVAMLLVVAWVVAQDVHLGPAGYLTRGLTFGLLGGLVGLEAQLRRRAEAERESLLARVSTLAATDELTQLPNRRSWYEALRAEVERARREGSGLAVALLDLDRFKRYNDAHGHPAGDELLRRAASVWRSRMRVMDTLGRYGGEEFAVLLPSCPPADACEVIERLREVTPLGQTVSAGVAHWDGRETAESLVERADRALYEAKRTGRDRCVQAAA